MKAAIATAALLFATAAAHADDIVLTAPLAGATLHEAGIDMSVYYTEVEEGLEVVATYVARDEAPARLRMLMADGDQIRFGLPGERGVVYSFAREGKSVTVSGQRAATQIAMQ